MTSAYRIFGDFKFVTALGVLGGVESKHRIHFGPYAQDQPLQGIRFTVFPQNIEKPHQKFQKLSPTIFNLKTDFVITSSAFTC